MSSDAVRLALGASLVPFLPGLVLFTFGTIGAFDLVDSLPATIWLTLEIASVTGVIVWWLIWRCKVEWTRRRQLQTILLAALVLLSAAIVFVPTDATYWGDQKTSELIQTIVNSVPFFAATLWFGGSAYLWRSSGPTFDLSSMQSPMNYGAVVACPQCSYNLTGLREVRCPECGWASTVDDIVNRSLAEQFALFGGSV
ncbi:MAG TPA: hypothetical protein VJZ71_00395 [Phycisphaerae bacterium]|nr:hypothetical protein [Phycisphaerae bacterium]